MGQRVAPHVRQRPRAGARDRGRHQVDPSCAAAARVRTFRDRGGRAHLRPAWRQMLVPITGAYAERMVRLAREAGPGRGSCRSRKREPTPPAAVAAALAADPRDFSCRSRLQRDQFGHRPRPGGDRRGRCATRAGACWWTRFPRSARCRSTCPPSPSSTPLWFSTNKCLEGLPGMTFTVARTDRLDSAQRARRKLVVRPRRHLCPHACAVPAYSASRRRRR